MIFQYVNDKYVTLLLCNDTEFETKFQWCRDSFGPNFGEVSKGEPDRYGTRVCIFRFHLLKHAQWFQLKFDEF